MPCNLMLQIESFGSAWVQRVGPGAIEVCAELVVAGEDSAGRERSERGKSMLAMM